MASDDRAFGNIFHNHNKKAANLPDAKAEFYFPSALIEALTTAPKNGDGYVVVELAAWTKQGPKAGDYLSGNLQIKRASPSGSVGPRPKPNDTEIPF